MADFQPPEGPLRPLLVPSGPPRDPHAATVPWEALDKTHADHEDFVRSTGRCFADHECPYLPVSSTGEEKTDG